MRHFVFTSLLMLLGNLGCHDIYASVPKPLKTISKQQLVDKIKGGWAGQTIGTTYGWTTEFMYPGTYVQDYQTLPWHDDYINEAMSAFPGLYDDVYMDLMFVGVLEKKGLQAELKDFGEAFAQTKFQLWHANQVGRYNVQNGVAPEMAGNWVNNPHADDIDFQIEADFAGLMSPGMPKAATQISQKVGQLVNSGDGLYGGVFVANMYSNAFLSSDIQFVLENSLSAIPKQSDFYKIIRDVITWHKKHPKDWKQTWFLLQQKWSEEVGCPSMVYHPLNIDAKMNAAYVVMGLLYGEGDYTKTAEIATRAGQDSDCNPATALGVLGTIIGYSNIPDYWKAPLVKAENNKFSHTNYSLKDVYEIGYKHAIENLQLNGAVITGETITFPKYDVFDVPYVKNFEGHYPKETVKINRTVSDELEFQFEGVGFVLRGVSRDPNKNLSDILSADLYIDGVLMETAEFPTEESKTRADLFWKYQLPKGKHAVKVKIKRATSSQNLYVVDYLVYDNKPTHGMKY